MLLFWEYRKVCVVKTRMNYNYITDLDRIKETVEEPYSFRSEKKGAE